MNVFCEECQDYLGDFDAEMTSNEYKLYASDYLHIIGRKPNGLLYIICSSCFYSGTKLPIKVLVPKPKPVLYREI